MGVARSYGASALLLEVRPSNAAGRALYAAYGFEQVQGGYRPVLTVCAKADTHGASGVKVPGCTTFAPAWCSLSIIVAWMSRPQGQRPISASETERWGPSTCPSAMVRSSGRDSSNGAATATLV